MSSTGYEADLESLTEVGDHLVGCDPAVLCTGRLSWPGRFHTDDVHFPQNHCHSPIPHHLVLQWSEWAEMTLTRHRAWAISVSTRAAWGDPTPLPSYLKNQLSCRAPRGGVRKLSTRYPQSILKILGLPSITGQDQVKCQIWTSLYDEAQGPQYW